ncbi:WG repeat-containing protein [Neobacillus sp. PS3-40]|uniref:WG repeat-containing protein n=1 Tax=Neobacillus sp. PS3-40 TaxID=3070679 RepID=UPI0027E13E89|nr:WG repeat-containing protein [Neobacillus sp. PS3-40]WML42932.1 WG repeat-containing protein [Neobacillus sp. PS3-40]
MFRKDGDLENVNLPLRPFGAEALSAPYYYQRLRESEVKESRARGVYLFPISIKEIGGNKWGYMNEKGKIILPPIYEHAGDFQDNGLAIVRLLDLSGVINSNGYFIVKPKYDTINPFSEGRATVINHLGFKVIDESGKETTSKVYSFIGDYKEGRALIANTDEHGKYLYGYLNRRGKEVLPLEFESASDFHEGKAVVKNLDGSYSLIGLAGKIIKTYPYAFVGNYGEGLLAFQKTAGGNFGYMDEQGEIVIGPQFSEARPFIEGRAIVNVSEEFKGHYGLIDRNGHFILKPHYQTIISLGEGRVAIGKAIIAEKPYVGSLYAIADIDGHILTGFIYNGLTKFVEGRASAYNEQSTFFIDINGKRIESLPTVLGSGELHFDKTLIKAEVDFRLQYFTNKSEVVWEQNQLIPLNSQYSVIEKKYKPNKDYLVFYPQVMGMQCKEAQMKVNQDLKDFSAVKVVPTQKQLDSSYTGDFEVTYYQKNLLVIEKTGYDYPFGAAHGMPLKKFAHIDLNTGPFYQLNDLFKDHSQYVKTISHIIADQIQSNEKYSYIFLDRYKGIREDQPFFITEGALNLYFNPYEIGPYVAGFPTFTVPFEEIADLLNQEGNFWKSFN